MKKPHKKISQNLITTFQKKHNFLTQSRIFKGWKGYIGYAKIAIRIII
jgi:hypothetical protein